MHTFYAYSSSLSVPVQISVAVEFFYVGAFYLFFATPTPYPMHDDAQC